MQADELGPNPGMPRGNEPPTLLRIYSPGGDTMDMFGWVGFRNHPKRKRILQLICSGADGVVMGLSPLVTIINKATGMVVYDPRETPSSLEGFIEVLRPVHVRWLAENKHWPAILELYDNPTEEKPNEDIEE